MTTLSLQSRLANALPSSATLLIHHIVSESLNCPEIFAAPPNESPEPTRSESHLLSASVHHEGEPLQVLALEVYIYTTDTLTTIFISKADSTGYLNLLMLPKDTSSPMKIIVTTFLDWLIEEKRLNDKRLVLSLFARAQDQYLFPGSVENDGKHVLDDRGLIRWWCRVLDPILLNESNHTANAHLIIPGLDKHETRAYFPKRYGTEKSRWTANDPLQTIGTRADLPTRCYIPRFPDDPKARFVTDLDDELPEESLETETTGKGRSPGIWKSVKSLAGFWELMSFRQECSAGRLVGFIWVVFEPIKSVDEFQQAQVRMEGQETQDEPTLPTPLDSQHQYLNMVRTIESSESTNLGSLENGLLSPLPSSQPHQPIEEVTDRPSQASQVVATRGELPDSAIKLDDRAYKDILLLLDNLDYANLELALDSTAKFIKAVSKGVDIDVKLGFEVQGKVSASIPAAGVLKANDFTVNNTQTKDTPVNLLNTGMVRSKKRAVDDVAPLLTGTNQSEVRILSATSIRKKPKV